MERVRDRIVDYVAKCIINQHSTTLSSTDISKGMKITQPLIFYHFKNMRELMKEAYLHLSETDVEGFMRCETRERLCCKSLIHVEG